MQNEMLNPEECLLRDPSKKSFFQKQHENLLFSCTYAVHILEEEKSEPNWMIAQLLPDFLNLLHSHCMLEEDFMILTRYPDYFWHEKEHKKLLLNWRRCSQKNFPGNEKKHLIRESSLALSRHIATLDSNLGAFAEKNHFPDEISLLKMYGIRFGACGLFPKKN